METAPGFRLVVIAGASAGQTMNVTADVTPIKIGRKSSNPARDIEILGRPADPNRDLLLNEDPDVSRVHATIKMSGSTYLLTDCGSLNHTRHNQQLLEPWKPVVLQDRDEVAVGPQSVVRFELEVADQDQPLPPPTPIPQPPPDLATVSRRTHFRETDPSNREEPWGEFSLLQSVSESDGLSVYRAVLRDGSVPVALKRAALARLSAKPRAALLECAEKGHRWSHAGIAEVSAHGTERDTLFIATRWIEGKTLSDLQRERFADIEIPLALSWTRDICAALRSAQGVERGFVWRNLNPRNVLIDPQGHAVLINFGLPSVRLLINGDKATDTPEARYLSPEHRYGKETDARSDLYSAGVILYELLGQKLVDHTQKILKDAVGLRKDLPWDVADTVNKAVAYRPERRFLHAADMEEALDGLLTTLYAGYDCAAVTWLNELRSENREGADASSCAQSRPVP
jgi:hypothetical protein